MVTGKCSWQYWVHCNRYWAVSFTLCPTNNWYWYYRKKVCFSRSYFKIGHISGVQILFSRGHKDQLHCNFSNFFFRFTLEDWNIIVAPRNRRNPVEQVDSVWGASSWKICGSGAVKLSRWASNLCYHENITSETTFEIHYWKGTYRGKWSPQNVAYRRVPWTEELPKTCALLHSFDLTDY